MIQKTIQLCVLVIFCVFTGALTNSLQAEIITIDGTVKSVDVKKRTITVTTGTKDKTLDVGSKAKISLDGEDGSLNSLKAGQSVSLSYHDQLEVVVKIESRESSNAGESNAEILNLDELNTSDSESSPFVSLDGLEIFWVSGGESESSLSIWTAKRKDPQSLFGEKKRLFAGHAPVLSADGLELYFRSTSDTAVSRTVRDRRSDDFERPEVVPSLKFPSENDVAPRWLTVDGLTMYLDFRMTDSTGKMRHHTVTSTRESLSGKWSKPKPIEIEFDGIPKDFRVAHVSATPDHLNLLCAAEFSDVGTERLFRLGILSRPQPRGAFTTWTEIPLTTADGQHPVCHKPQFLNLTKELFLVSPDLNADPQIRAARKEDIWVIKDFRPPVPISDDGLQFPLDGHWKLIDGYLGDGKKIADGRTSVIRGNKYKLMLPSKTIEGTILVDPTEFPMHLTWIPETGGSDIWKGKKLHGIWELTDNGTVFRFISGGPDAARPTDFRPKPGYPVQVFKRVNP